MLMDKQTLLYALGGFALGMYYAKHQAAALAKGAIQLGAIQMGGAHYNGLAMKANPYGALAMKSNPYGALMLNGIHMSNPGNSVTKMGMIK